jgi:hypothetical protein
MNNATHAVVITKPGHSTVRFGPLLQTMADEWRMRLESALVGTAHPEGTTTTVEPFRPGTDGAYIDPGSIPASVDELMEPLRADTGNDDPAARFPDLYTRLVMRHGQTGADSLWTHACDLANWEAEIEQAEQDIQKDITAARAALTEALASAGQALLSLQAARSAADRHDLGIPAQVAVYRADAAEHIAVALRELRAAGLALQPAAEA